MLMQTRLIQASHRVTPAQQPSNSVAGLRSNMFSLYSINPRQN